MHLVVTRPLPRPLPSRQVSNPRLSSRCVDRLRPFSTQQRHCRFRQGQAPSSERLTGRFQFVQLNDLLPDRVGHRCPAVYHHSRSLVAVPGPQALPKFENIDRSVTGSMSSHIQMCGVERRVNAVGRWSEEPNPLELRRKVQLREPLDGCTGLGCFKVALVPQDWILRILCAARRPCWRFSCDGQQIRPMYERLSPVLESAEQTRCTRAETCRERRLQGRQSSARRRESERQSVDDSIDHIWF